MKNIGIDARLYFQTGVGTYLRNFLNNLQKISPRDLLFYVYVLKNESKRITLSNKNFIKRETTTRWHTFDEQLTFLKILYGDDLDLMHFTYFSYPVLYRKKFIATIHDTTPLLFKTGKASTQNRLIYEIKHQLFKSVLKNQVEKAARLITPTKTVKKQLINLYGKGVEDKIIPIYEGIDEELKEAARYPELVSGSKKRFLASLRSLGMTVGPFFIYVGNFYPHKNVERLVYAFSKVKENIQLILIGPDDFFARKIVLREKVVFYHNPTPSDLVFFYKNAVALIHPSLSEGFGLPLLEAAYFGCPIIASDIEVFKELLDEKYISFDPLSINEIAEKITFFLHQKPKFDYHQLLKKYSFKQMTRETLKIYQGLW